MNKKKKIEQNALRFLKENYSLFNIDVTSSKHQFICLISLYKVLKRKGLISNFIRYLYRDGTEYWRERNEYQFRMNSKVIFTAFPWGLTDEGPYYWRVVELIYHEEIRKQYKVYAKDIIDSQILTKEEE